MAEILGAWKRTCYCAEAAAKRGETVVLMGWVQRARDLGGLVFVTLRDRSGQIQLVFDEPVCGKEGLETARSLRGEFVVAVSGKVRARAAEAVNNKMATGAVEVMVESVKLLNRAETPPIYIDDDHADENEAVRLKYRYLDLRRPSLQSTLMMRAKVVNAVRNHLSGEGFIELETPMLSKSTPEGARDYLVPSRVHPGSFYALPQSPQIYKQLLMLGGYDKYFQLARCFRDEDLRADRQPEFTQADIEMSFVEQEDVMKAIEGVFEAAFEAAEKTAPKMPLERITWHEAMNRYGSDKPDRRFGLEIQDVSALAQTSGFKVFEQALEAGGTVRGINASGLGAKLSRKEIDALGEFVKGFGAKGLAWAVVGADGLRSSFAKAVSEDVMQGLLAAVSAKEGDAVFFVADKKDIVLQALGQLRLELGKRFELIDKAKYDLFWVVDFPQFEWSEEDGRFYAMHHPFTSPMDEDVKYLDSDLGRVRAKAYDVVLNGIEMGSGSIRIHDSAMQERMFGYLGFTKDEAWERFGFLLEAFKYGTPPHGGFAFGVDRLIMMLLGKDSLRDVIAFPKVQNASCLMMATPAPATSAQLDVLHLGVLNTKQEV